MKNYIVGLGEILFDCLPDGKKLGGAPANFAYHVSQFGLNGIVVSAIGNDDNGEEIKEILSNTPSLEYHLEQVAEPTGTVQVTLSGNGIPQYDICLGVAYDNIPWTPGIEEIAKNTRVVCFGLLAQRTAVSRNTIYKFLDTMPQLGTLKVFDINLRQNWYSKEVIEESLNRCNVLKINDEEIIKVSKLLDLGEITDVDPNETLLQPVHFEDQVRDLIRIYDLQMVVLTCGAFGSYVMTIDKLSFQPTPKVQVADTVGAGDSFTGSFSAAILAGKSIEEAHKIGVDVSAFVCTQAGAMPQYPKELVERVRE
ncbi:MAG: carbohydrate kinase [Bacteroidales bacterium]|nr:carbohydrate kinase [Candidatus Minthousia equi]MDO4956134.1 carbohydrate kinase [Bacteroidales bacterium]